MKTKIELVKTKLAEASRIVGASLVGFGKSHIEQGKAPANFWLALVNVLDELRIKGEAVVLADWEWLLEDYSVPYVVRHFLLHGYVHPMHYSELKLLADYETWHANEEQHDLSIKTAQKLHGAVYALFDRECGYHLYALRGWCETSDIPYAPMSAIEAFVWVFGKDKVPATEAAQQWLKMLDTGLVQSGGDICFSTWCEWYIGFHELENISNDQRVEAVAILEKYHHKDNFLYIAVDMEEKSDEVYGQCKQYKQTTDRDLQEKLLARWARIADFVAHTDEGDEYYTLDSVEGVVERYWNSQLERCQNQLKYGLCFRDKDTADKFAEML